MRTDINILLIIIYLQMLFYKSILTIYKSFVSDSKIQKTYKQTKEKTKHGKIQRPKRRTYRCC